jgi:FkbM family methyltransferase
MTIDFEKIKPNLDLIQAKPGPMYVYKNDGFVSKAIRYYGEYCHAEVDIMKMFVEKNSIYIDVGVNIGYHALAMHKDSGCAVVGFEPNPTHFALAVENCKGLPIQLFNAALGSKIETISMSDIPPFNTEGNYGETGYDNEGTVEAKCITLDSLNLPKISGIKIDVEGYEYKVMKGAENTIDKYRPVILYEALQLEWDKCHDFLDHKGYRQYWIGCYNTPVKNETFIPKKENDDSGFGLGGITNIIAVPNELPRIDNLIPVVEGEAYADAAKRIQSYVLMF